MRLLLYVALLVSLSSGCLAQKKDKTGVRPLKDATSKSLDAGASSYNDIAMRIWNFAEVGYKEEKSSSLLASTLESSGFKVQRAVAGLPTAFVATYGSGEPVIGILAEFDALPGLSQAAVPERKSVSGQDAGHGCGHHLFGTASVAAGIELKRLMESGKLKGTIKVFGTPAEEGGSGKVFMVRAGLFKGVSAVLHWHPGDRNEVIMSSALANKSAKFRFYGVSAHAAAAPEKGRSALDGVEALNYMVNMMREHAPAEARIHYVITNGGRAPNVIPDFAEVYYYVRHPKRDQTVAIFDRIVKAAEGAALGTETRTDYEIIGGTHDLLINRTLAEVMYENLRTVGGVAYSQDDSNFAEKIQESLSQPPPVGNASTVVPLKKEVDVWSASTDVGDVSYSTPTVGLRAATWVPGTAPHTWQAVAAGGTPIGLKGMMVAAKVMTWTAIDLLSDADIIRNATAEFKQSVGDYQYKALLGDKAPALNYRD